jgi:hypothetical protein
MNGHKQFCCVDRELFPERTEETIQRDGHL